MNKRKERQGTERIWLINMNVKRGERHVYNCRNDRRSMVCPGIALYRNTSCRTCFLVGKTAYRQDQ